MLSIIGIAGEVNEWKLTLQPRGMKSHLEYNIFGD